MRCRAAIFETEGEPLVLGEIEVDAPRERECLVKLEATGLCHTDLYTMSGADPSAYFPAILGHEGAGVVVETGPGVESLSVGDRVVPLFVPECRACVPCTSGETNLCEALDRFYDAGLMPDGTTRLHYPDGREIKHYMNTSTFAEYTVVHEWALARVPEGIPLERACLFGCGIPTGIGAALWTAQVRSGSTCVVFGCGPIGLNIVQGCRLAGAGTIIAVDLRQERLETARAFGATHTVDASEYDGNAVAAVKELCDPSWGGADFSFEATGRTGVMRQALEATRLGGGQCVVAGVAGKGETLNIVPRLLIGGRRLTGTAFGGCRGRTQVPELLERYRDGDVLVDELVTAEVPLDEINGCFERMKAGDGLRFVIRY